MAGEILNQVFEIIDAQRKRAQNRQKQSKIPEFKHDKGIEIHALNELKSELTMKVKEG
jgi:hypothetical protein